jgi:hypothetical protein
MRVGMRGWLAAATVVSALSCGTKDSAGPDNNNPSITTRVVGIRTVGGVQGVARTGNLPAAGNGPGATLPPSLSTINGGTSVVTVGGSSAITRILVAVDGLSGYYEIDLPQSVTTAQILMTLAQTVSAGTLRFSVLVGNASALGAVGHLNATVRQVGTGDVQVSVFWNTPSDVDLHVVGPDGIEVYYGTPVTATGGTLDLDSNAECEIDNVNNENIRWPAGQALAGTYTVRVDYWASCGVASTDYVVTINVSGRTPQVFTGTFTGPGDFGGGGDGRLITTFTK